MKMEHLLLIIVGCVLLLPVLRFLISRMYLWLWLNKCKRNKDIQAYFLYKPLSIFSGIKGKHSDLIIIKNNKVLITKIIGGVFNKKVYEVNTYGDWSIKFFIPLPLPVMIDKEGVSKQLKCKFDLTKEKTLLQNKCWNIKSDFEVEGVWFFNPVPLSVKEIVHKNEKELYGGDTCYGMRIITKRTLLNTFIFEDDKREISERDVETIKSIYKKSK